MSREERLARAGQPDEPGVRIAAPLGVAPRGLDDVLEPDARAISFDDVRPRRRPCARGGTFPSSSRGARRPCPCGCRRRAASRPRDAARGRPASRRSPAATGTGSCGAAPAASFRAIAARSARATSKIAALPDALSLAPADSWQRCAVRTISPAAGVGARDRRRRRRRRSPGPSSRATRARSDDLLARGEARAVARPPGASTA